MVDLSIVIEPTAKGVRVAGELDAFTAPQLERTVEGMLMVLDGDVVDIDLSECTFVDSAGLHALLRSAHSAARHGLRLILWHPSPTLRRLLAITGLDAGAPFSVEA